MSEAMDTELPEARRTGSGFLANNRTVCIRRG